MSSQEPLDPEGKMEKLPEWPVSEPPRYKPLFAEHQPLVASVSAQSFGVSALAAYQVNEAYADHWKDRAAYWESRCRLAAAALENYRGYGVSLGHAAMFYAEDALLAIGPLPPVQP